MRLLTWGLKGAGMNCVPNAAKILSHINLIQPGASETIYFNAPEKPGDYTILCTYPGHAMIMPIAVQVVK
jgi:azurin